MQLLIDIAQGKLPSISDAESMVIMTMVFSFVLSIPSFLLLLLTSWLVNKQTDNTFYIKAILSVTGVLLSVLPFMLLTGKTLPDVSNPDFVWVMLYPITIVAGIWIFKLKQLPYKNVIS